jgi:hypothetical protein
MAVGSGGVVAAVRELADRLDPERYQELCNVLAGVTRVLLGKETPLLKDVQSEVFRGKLPLKWKWLGFAMEVQYGGFFVGLGSSVQDAIKRAVATSSSSSPPPSPGPSGGS